MNPGGSIKDRTCKSILLSAKKWIVLFRNQTLKNPICEGTSGSTGISLTLLANSLGL